MPIRLIPSFLFFCYVNMITPGPANLCSLSAALNYGRTYALRQWRGLFVGFAVISILSVFMLCFLGNLLGDYVRWLSFVGAAYLFWLAIHTVRSTEETTEYAAAKNCNFLTGFLLQMTNVKIMVFCVTALGSYVLPYNRSFLGLLMVGGFLPFTGPVCNLVWLYIGTKLQSVFQRHRKGINWIMALALAGCAVSLLIGSSVP